jgi:hypothetical protein
MERPEEGLKTPEFLNGIIKSSERGQQQTILLVLDILAKLFHQ